MSKSNAPTRWSRTRERLRRHYPDHVIRFAAASEVDPHKIRFCHSCGAVAFAVDEYERAQLDRLEFQVLCPRCRRGSRR